MRSSFGDFMQGLLGLMVLALVIGCGIALAPLITLGFNYALALGLSSETQNVVTGWVEWLWTLSCFIGLFVLGELMSEFGNETK